MKYLKIAFLIGLSCCFWQCGTGEWDVTLYAQKIEGTSKVLYKYDAWGGRDSHVEGYVILDSTETFEVDRSDLLPISQLNGIPDKDYISAIKVSKPEEETSSVYTPIENTEIEKEGFRIKIKKYGYDAFANRGRGLEKYVFESFKETRDSIYFYNLDDITSAEPSPHLDELKLKKGNVIIRQDNKKIIEIDIEDLILSKPNNELISNLSYFLTPKKALKSDAFSDYGIFKEVVK